MGDPARPLIAIPACGCDACDSGPQDVLNELDQRVLGVVSGAFRRLWKGDREITVIAGVRWSGSGGFARGEVEAILSPIGRLARARRRFVDGCGLKPVPPTPTA